MATLYEGDCRAVWLLLTVREILDLYTMASSKTIVITVPKARSIYSIPKHNQRSFSIPKIAKDIRYHSYDKQIIHTMASNISLSNLLDNVKDELSDDDDLQAENTKPPRKRQRLDHLSLEQKILRR